MFLFIPIYTYNVFTSSFNSFYLKYFVFAHTNNKHVLIKIELNAFISKQMDYEYHSDVYSTLVYIVMKLK